MSAQPPPGEPDESADTQMFRKFVEADDPAPPQAGGNAFRIATLLIGLVVFAGLAYLLLKL